MADLGSFDVAAKAVDPDREPDTFTLCGEKFTVATEISVVPLGMFAKAAKSGLDTAEMDGLAAMIDMISQCVVDDDVDRFLAVASKNRVDAELLLKIVQAVMEAQTAFPTVQPSDSSDGESTTGPSSKVLSSSAVSSRPSWRDTPFGRRELAAVPELYEGVEPLSEAAASVKRTLAG